MRKIKIIEHILLDGVIQAPGGPEEDSSGGFAYGGWAGPHADPEAGGESPMADSINVATNQAQRPFADQLLPRRGEVRLLA
jgi:hypothetical protein